jgi:hypothetical protein
MTVVDWRDDDRPTIVVGSTQIVLTGVPSLLDRTKATIE